jgi:hypothetical protein
VHGSPLKDEALLSPGGSYAWHVSRLSAGIAKRVYVEEQGSGCRRFRLEKSSQYPIFKGWVLYYLGLARAKQYRPSQQSQKSPQQPGNPPFSPPEPPFNPPQPPVTPPFNPPQPPQNPPLSPPQPPFSPPQNLPQAPPANPPTIVTPPPFSPPKVGAGRWVWLILAALLFLVPTIVCSNRFDIRGSWKIVGDSSLLGDTGNIVSFTDTHYKVQFLSLAYILAKDGSNYRLDLTGPIGMNESYIVKVHNKNRIELSNQDTKSPIIFERYQE